MGKQMGHEELCDHIERTITILQRYLMNMAEGSDVSQHSKAIKLAYWLKSYIGYIKFEKRFDPKRLLRYDRGSIIKVDLGFNIGSEEGGRRYAVVVENKNSINSPVVVVVPLTSVKPRHDINKLHKGDVFLGNELFTTLNGKLSSSVRLLEEKTACLVSLLDKIEAGIIPAPEVKMSPLRDQIAEINKDIGAAKKIKVEVQGMKQGSIALVSQIVTVSKIRLDNPKRRDDSLYGVKLSNEKMDLIDCCIRALYTKG